MFFSSDGVRAKRKTHILENTLKRQSHENRKVNSGEKAAETQRYLALSLDWITT
jgi:hypothetical protein